MSERKCYSVKEVVAELQNEIERCGSQNEAARRMKISQGFVWQIVHGYKAPSALVLEGLGFDPAPHYFKKLVR